MSELTGAQKQEACAMFNERGMTVGQISDHFGVSIYAITPWIWRSSTAEQERLRFEGDLDKWMKTLGAGITGYQPEAYTLMDMAVDELVKLRKQIEAAKNILEKCGDYFEARSDSDCDHVGFIPNEEMQILAEIREIIK